MKKLFLAIRHGDIDEVKAILERKPEAVDEPAAPPPKKDKGLSPLQVALKTGGLDIAEYLIKAGADVNYIDPIDENENDIWSVPVLQDAIRAVFSAYDGISPNIEAAEKATAIVCDMLIRGANPNALSWRTVVEFGESSLRQDVDAFGACIGCASLNKKDPELRNLIAKKLTELLDLMLKYGADLEAWASRPANCHCNENETARKRYIDDFVPVPDKTVNVIHRGNSVIPVGDKPIEPQKGDRHETVVIDGSIDRTAEWRMFMQDFCKKRGLLGT